MLQKFHLMPASASTLSGRVDELFLFLVAVTIVFSVGICATVLFFSVRYRRRKGRRATPIEASLPLEVLWTVVPLGLSLGIFFWGANLYFEMVKPPVGGLDVYVTAKQWMWKLQHPDGQREINDLHVPVDTQINLTMISEDVIHSFFVPDFRMKRDVVPGRYSRAWFEATQPGRYKLLCAEYCGTKHSQMIGWVYVLEQEEYERWLAGNLSGETPAQQGAKLFTQMRCDSCHNQTPAARAPYLGGRFGAASTLDDGTRVEFDEEYLRESIYRPLAKKVAGWDPVMPTYEGQVSESQVLEILAYLQTLEAAPAAAAPGSPDGEAPAPPAPGAGGEESKEDGR